MMRSRSKMLQGHFPIYDELATRRLFNGSNSHYNYGTSELRILSS